MYMASKRRARARWRGVAQRAARRPAGMALAAAVSIAAAARPSPLSAAAAILVLGYQLARVALPAPRAAWPPR